MQRDTDIYSENCTTNNLAPCNLQFNFSQALTIIDLCCNNYQMGACRLFSRLGCYTLKVSKALFCWQIQKCDALQVESTAPLRVTHSRIELHSNISYVCSINCRISSARNAMKKRQPMRWSILPEHQACFLECQQKFPLHLWKSTKKKRSYHMNACIPWQWLK